MRQEFHPQDGGDKPACRERDQVLLLKALRQPGQHAKAQPGAQAGVPGVQAHIREAQAGDRPPQAEGADELLLLQVVRREGGMEGEARAEGHAEMRGMQAALRAEPLRRRRAEESRARARMLHEGLREQGSAQAPRDFGMRQVRQEVQAAREPGQACGADRAEALLLLDGMQEQSAEGEGQVGDRLEARLAIDSPLRVLQEEVQDRRRSRQAAHDAEQRAAVLLEGVLLDIQQQARFRRFAELEAPEGLG